MINSDVFHSFEEACDVMRQVRTIGDTVTVQSENALLFLLENVWQNDATAWLERVQQLSITRFIVDIRVTHEIPLCRQTTPIA